VATTSDALAWISFAILLVVALIGFTMLAIWIGQRRRRTAAASSAPGAGMPAEQNFPDAVVGLHGVLAATTLVLVLLTAAGVGS
jgi:manganese efflux pump family protein